MHPVLLTLVVLASSPSRFTDAMLQSGLRELASVDVHSRSTCPVFDLKPPLEVLRPSAKRADVAGALQAIHRAYGIPSSAARDLLMGYLVRQSAIRSYDDALLISFLERAAKSAPDNAAVVCMALDEPSQGMLHRLEGIEPFVLSWLRKHPHPSEVALRLVELGAGAESTGKPNASRNGSLQLLRQWAVGLLMMAAEVDPLISPERVVSLLDVTSEYSSRADGLALRLTLYRRPGLSPEARERMASGLVKSLALNELPSLVAEVLDGIDPTQVPLTDDQRGFVVVALRQGGDIKGAQKWRNGPVSNVVTQEEVRGESSPQCQALHQALAHYALEPAPHPDAFDLKCLQRQCAYGLHLLWSEVLAEALSAQYPTSVRDDFRGDLETWYENSELKMKRPAPTAAYAAAWTSIRSAELAQKTDAEAILDRLPPSPKAPASPTVVALPPELEAKLQKPLLMIFKVRSKAAISARASGRPMGELPLPWGFEWARGERNGRQTVVVALSQRMDPTGEVSRGAFWLLLSHDGGAHWDAPIYTGLRSFRPYVLKARSSIPILSNGVVRLEVAEMPIHESSITRPPVALTFEKERGGLVLEAPLQAILQDSDGDGLSDLVEDRWLLDPHNNDSDGDGVLDGEDEVPNMARPAAPSVESELVSALFDAWEQDSKKYAAVSGVSLSPAPDRVRYLAMERSQAERLRPTSRALVIDPSWEKALRARFGTFYPVQLQLEVNVAADKALITWDEDWRGGGFVAERRSHGWVLLPFGNWFT